MVASYRQPRRQLLSVQQRLKIGLVGYWPSAVAAAVDLKAELWGDGAVPGSLDLTNNGVVTRVAGPSNNLPNASRYVVASSQALTVPDSTYLQPRNAKFAFAIWANPDGVAASQNRVMMGKWGTAANLEWSVSHLLATTFFSFSVSANGTAATTVTVSVAAAAGSWYFATGWWDGVRIYLRIYFPNGTISQNSAAFTGPIFAGTSVFSLSSLLSANSRWSGDLSNAYYWIGNIPSIGDLNWLWNNGQGNTILRVN